jgi:hypothetical protein
MPALLINIKIDRQEKFDLFKVTLADLKGMFDECHIKIRGSLAQACVEYAKIQFEGGARFYQDLQEADWVAATLVMLAQVESRSVFLYFEDHKLVAPHQQLKQVLAEFDERQLDYLCYSFFRASQLDGANLLPLGGRKQNAFHEFLLSRGSLELLSKISPGYYTYSLVSMASVDYFRAVLTVTNCRHKLDSKWIAALLMRIFRYPGYRRVVHRMNQLLRYMSVELCIYPPASPFNLEKIWFETVLPNAASGWKFGIAAQELFANYDDDNGAYGESLIKKGLYPFAVQPQGAMEMRASDMQKLRLEPGETFDCTYHSRKGRISRAPQVELKVTAGKVSVHCQGSEFQVAEGGSEFFCSNLGPIIHCVERAEIQIRVFDEVF